MRDVSVKKKPILITRYFYRSTVIRGAVHDYTQYTCGARND